MLKQLRYRIKEAIRPKAMVLMYHRIARLESDVWDIAVSPAHFEEQLQLLKKEGKVISMKALAEGVRKGNLKRNSIAITFDDGYVDNFEAAKPLLEKYELPATFFITTGNIGQSSEFWWDELEHIILFTEQLPQLLNLTIKNEQLRFDIKTETGLSETLRQKHLQWHGLEEAPPSLRAQVYLQIWQQLRPLPHTEQQKYLAIIREWAGLPSVARETYKSMTVAQLQQLASSELFDIGIHTVNHPALAYHNPKFQEQEVMESRQYLEKATGKQIMLMAYPFGNYAAETEAIIAKAKLLAALTTEEKLIKADSHPYRFGRFQVKDWSGSEFYQHLQQWKKAK